MHVSLLIGTLAFFISFIATPVWHHIANRIGFVAQPGPRRIHRTPVPTAGGLVVFVAYWGGLFLSGEVAASFTDKLPLLIGTTFIVLLGLVDDLYDLKPSVKLAGQILAAAVFVIPAWHEPLYLSDGYALSGAWSGLLALLWLVAMSNMFNIIDGLDGLATGVAIVVTVPLFVLAWKHELVSAALSAAAVFGAAAGFLRYNAHPARLFLGDSGGMFLGFVLGVVSLQAVLRGPLTVASPIALLIVAVPVLDTTCAIIRRVSRGQPIAQADAMHIHHQLLRHGRNMRQAVFFLYGVSAVTAAAALLLAWFGTWHGWIVVTICSFVGFVWAQRLGVLGDALPGVGVKSEPPQGQSVPLKLRPFESREPSFVTSERVDFHEETGKFRGIAK